MHRRPVTATGSEAVAITLLRLDWLEVLPGAGCALCLLAWRKGQRYVATCLDEAVTDVAQRDAWRAAGGFCPWHAAMAAATPQSAGSLAMLYADLLQHQTTGFAALLPPARRAWRAVLQRCQTWLRRRSAPAVCPACQLWQAQEHLYLHLLLEGWPAPDLQNAFHASQGLCWPHTRQLIAVGRGHRHFAAVLTAQLAHCQHLQDELQAFIRKLDYRFARDPYGSEADAWQRAMRLASGPRAWPEPREMRPPPERS
ncbi:MAG: DUF6062 family protein [Candidatus Tectimicrobiota bacterium]